MAASMANRKTIAVQKLHGILPICNLFSSYFCPRNDIFVYLHKDGTLQSCKYPESDKCGKIDEGTKRYEVISPKFTKVECQLHIVSISKRNDDYVVRSICTSKGDALIDPSPETSVKDIPDTEASYFESGAFLLWRSDAKQTLNILFSNEVLCCTVECKEPVNFVERCKLDWVTEREDVIQVIEQMKFLFALHSSGNISIFSAISFKQIARISFRDVAKLLFEKSSESAIKSLLSNKASHFCVSSSLRHIVITTSRSKFGIFRVELDHYFRTYPSHLCSASKDKDWDQSLGPREELQDRSWRGLLSRKMNNRRKLENMASSVGSVCWHDILDRYGNLNEEFSIQKFTFRRTRFGKATNITGFSAKLGHHQQQPGTHDEEGHQSLAIKTPKEARDSPVAGVHITESSAVVWYSGPPGSPDNYGGICVAGLREENAEFYVFNEPTTIAYSLEESHPHVLLTSEKLYLLAPSVNQNALVNQLMIFRNAALAEGVSQLNNWDHCSIPTHALEVGLKHRQLDTVAFFLRGRENTFRLSSMEGGTRTLPKASEIPNTSADQDQLWKALDLLTSAIQTNIQEPQARQYGQQLLHLTLNFLHVLIQNATHAKSQLKKLEGTTTLKVDSFAGSLEDLGEVISCLMTFVTNLRQYLTGVPKDAVKKKSTSSDEQDGVHMLSTWGLDNQMAGSAFERWNKFSTEEVIKDAVINGQIPLAQAFFQKKQRAGQVGSKVIEPIVIGRMQDLIKIAQTIAYNSLQDGDVETAKCLFLNMGFDVPSELRKICFFTADKRLRDFLVSEVRKIGHLSLEEEAVCSFSHHFEVAYNCRSYQKAKGHAKENLSVLWDDKSFNLCPLRNEEFSQFLTQKLRTGELVPSAGVPDSKNFKYGNVLLEWANQWDKLTKDRILLQEVIHSKERDESEETDISSAKQWIFEAESVWKYLLSHEDWLTLKSWIHRSLSTDHTAESAYLPLLFAEVKVQREFVDQIEDCSDHMKKQILDELARYGFFSSHELSDFEILLRRLVHCGKLFSSPSILPDKDLQSGFNAWFINYCIKQNLPSVLYMFMDLYGLCLSKDEALNMKLPSADTPWLEILLNFRWVGNQISDPFLVFNASLANARLQGKVLQPSVTSLLQDGRIMVAIATMLYAPGTISEALTPALNEDERIWKVDAHLLNDALRPYPRLQNAIFPPQNLNGVPAQDITLYQMLKGNLPLDHNKLFLWQTTNVASSGRLDVSDSIHLEMPHFSQPDLVKQFAYSECFSFSHFLRQGRPSFAYTAFLVNLLQSEGNNTKLRVSQAYMKAYSTALRNPTSNSILAACVVFVYMLGKDTLPLRVDVHAAKLIIQHHKVCLGLEGGRLTSTTTLSKSKEELEKRIRELVILFLHCLRGSKSSAKSLLDLLESAITTKLTGDGIDLTSWDAAELWTLASLFSQNHNLPNSSKYLSLCAKRNQWLQFTCFSQLQQYPQCQILELVKEFESHSLREHLRSAFENLKFGPAFPAEANDQSPTKKGVLRDLREKYYQRTGVINRPEETSPSEEGDQVNLEVDQEAEVSSEMEEIQPSDLDPDAVPRELFGVILECNKHPSPWTSLLAHAILLQQPILAVISSCYKNASVMECLSTWLLTSLSERARSKFTQGYHPVPSFQWRQWTSDELFRLVFVAVECGAVAIAQKAFYIFDHENPMNFFLKFSCDFLLKRDLSSASNHLEKFNNSLLKCKRYESVLKDQARSVTQKPKVGGVKWFLESSSKVASYMLTTCKSQWELTGLLKSLSEVGLSSTNKGPDFKLLYNLNEILCDTEVRLNIKEMWDLRSQNFKNECSRIIDRLQELQRLEGAKRFAKTAGMPLDDLIISQMEREFTDLRESKSHLSRRERVSFWKKCHSSFKANRVTDKVASEYFKGWAERADKLSSAEKAFLLHLALTTASSGQVQEEYLALEREMWKFRFKAEVAKSKQVLPNRMLSYQDTDFLSRESAEDALAWECLPTGHQELLFTGQEYSEITPKEEPLDDKEIAALGNIVDNLIEKGAIIQAHKLSLQFDHSCLDLHIILSCIKLAVGAIHSYGLDSALRQLVMKPEGFQRKTSEVGPVSSMMSLSSGWRHPAVRKSQSVANLPGLVPDMNRQNDIVDQTLSTMETLAEHCTHGKNTCQAVIAAYKISKMLQMTYEEVTESTSLDVLKRILNSKDALQYEYAKKWVETRGMTDNEVASFISDLVLSGLRATFMQRREGVVSKLATGSSHHHGATVFSPWADRAEFANLMKLPTHPSNLGNKLMEEVMSLKNAYADPSKQDAITFDVHEVLSLEVELLIRAHDAFSLSCHMEGISNVLRSCREVFNALMEKQEYPLMIRLLLGIARYTEMTYIFDELRAKQQIEPLLKKGAKDNSLKVCLLDYLRRCDPRDPETYNMVAVKFGMVREIAELLEKEGNKKLKALGKRPMDTNIELQNSLQEILQDYTKATQNYAKGNCLRHAERCVQKARLIAVQLHLLPRKIRILNLGLNDDKELETFLTKHQNFHEALIVKEAYGKQYEWSSAVYHNVVLNGEITYLDDFRNCMELQPSLFTDVMQRYQKEGSRQQLAIQNNMRQFLRLCPDILTMYQIASELNFMEITQSLLQGDSGPYLKDVVKK